MKYPQNRVNHRRYEWVSRTYSSERAFADHIAEVFTRFGIAYEREPGVKAALCRADFRIFGTLVHLLTEHASYFMEPGAAVERGRHDLR